jgi:hypothetical protein
MHAVVTSDDNIVLKALLTLIIRRRIEVEPVNLPWVALPVCIVAGSVGGL